MILAVDFLYVAFIMLRYISSILNLRDFYQENMVNFKSVSLSIEMIIQLFNLHFVNVMYHTYLFAYIKSSLYPRDKSHLVIVYEGIYVLLNSICYYFTKDFHLYLAGLLAYNFVFLWYTFLTLYHNNAGLIKGICKQFLILSQRDK